VYISSPAGLTDGLCGVTASVCVKGTVNAALPVTIVGVYGKLYLPGTAPANPLGGPPADASFSTIDADGHWCLGILDGAKPSATESSHVFCWVGYLNPTTGQIEYDVVARSFRVNCVSTLPECCESSSSSSSSSSSGQSSSSSSSGSSSSSWSNSSSSSGSA
jgi:uncharacterized membrane protein YgcG